MKLLTFLISSPYNNFLHMLINYLLEYGADVMILSFDNENDLLWKNIFSDIDVISQKDIKNFKMDYAIDLDDKLLNLPKISFALYKKNSKTIQAVSFIELNNNYSQPIIREINCSTYEKCLTLYRDIANALLENLMDVVLLVQQQQLVYNYCVKNFYRKKNYLKEFLKLGSIEKLQSYYDKVINEDDLLEISPLIIEKASENKQEIFISYVDEINTIEFFVIYLLYILNSRKDGICGYNFYKNNKGISKYIKVQFNDNYNNIWQQVNSELYHIIDNEIICLNANIKPDKQHPEIDIFFDSTESKDKNKIQIFISEITKSIKVIYDNNINMLDNVNALLENFLNSYHKFKHDKVNFNGFTHIDFNYYYSLKCISEGEIRHIDNRLKLHHLFEQQASIFPNKIALISETVKFTYKELNKLSNHIASYLIGYLNNTWSRIAVYVDNSYHMITAPLAILKAGCTYVPIDVDSPKEQVNFIINDAGVNIILTDKANSFKLDVLTDSMFTKIVLDDLICINIPDDKANNLEQLEITNDDAYIIYTSGSTGNPKGIVGSHLGIVNTLIFQKEMYLNQENDYLFGLFTNNTFDASICNIFLPLVSSNSLMIPPKVTKADMNYFIKNFKIDSLILSTRLLNLIDQISIKYLKLLIIGGEACDKKILKQFKNRDIKIIYEYGVTEAAVTSSYNLLNLDQEQDISIGKPIFNTNFYVVDQYNALLPGGVIGRLFIESIGVSRGYLNNLNLTKEIFLDNYIEGRPSQYLQLLNTCDLVYKLKDGTFNYIDRIDDQVKINGVRINLNPIKEALLQCNDIKDAAVITCGSKVNLKQIVAFIVINKSNQLIEEEYIRKQQEYYKNGYIDLDINNYKFNISGWNSTYNRASFTREEMRDWLDATIDRLKHYNCSTIFEIGSGSGLIMFNMLNFCKKYYFSDPAQEAIDYSNEVARKNFFRNVEGYCCPAHDISPRISSKAGIDLVVMNSIIQYFPSLNYLNSVIEKAINLFDKKGKIFIGDVRDLRLLSVFRNSVRMYKAKIYPEQEINEIYGNNDQELLIHPLFFMKLLNENQYIQSVEIIPKLGKLDTEMNKFRYDVFISIVKNNINYNNNQNIYIKNSEINLCNKLDLSFFNDIKNDFVAFKYPNKKIIEDYDAFYSNVPKELKFAKIYEFYEIEECAKKLDLNVKLYLDIFDTLYVNVICYPKDFENNSFIINYGNKDYAEYPLSSNPLESFETKFNLLISRLEEKFKSISTARKLPDKIIPIDNLPLTSNGKLDKQYLQNYLSKHSHVDYISPKNEYEQKLSKIWAQLLNQKEEKIGLNDNFFDLGGNSLVAIKFINECNKQFSIDVDSNAIFQNPTLCKIANYLKKLVNSKFKGNVYEF